MPIFAASSPISPSASGAKTGTVSVAMVTIACTASVAASARTT